MGAQTQQTEEKEMKIPTAIQTVNGRQVDLMALSPLAILVTVSLITATAAGAIPAGWTVALVWSALSWVFSVALCALYGGFRQEATDYNRRRYAR